MRYQAALRPDCSTNTADKRKFKGYIGYKFLINLVFNVIRDPMIIECPNCNKKFNLDKKLIPENGRTLKCSSCDNIWHYKISITKNMEDAALSKDNNIKLDTNIPEIEKEEDDQDRAINDDNLAGINQGVLSEESTEDEEDDIKDQKGKLKMVLVYFTIVIISLLGLIFLLDTFKSYLSSVFPILTPLIDSFYETVLDFKLFITDLTN